MARRPLRNNLRLLLAATAAALLLFVVLELLIRRSREFSPDFLASVLLYGLTVLNVTLLLVLLFVLGRHLVRAVMESRRGVLGARFRLRLALVFVLIAALPSLLLLLVGGDIIRQAVDRWFSVDVERMLSSSQALGTALRETVAERARLDARVLARELGARRLLEPAGQGRLRRSVEARAAELGLDLVSVYTSAGEILAVMDPALPAASLDPASGRALADSALVGVEAEATLPFGTGELVRVTVPVVSRGEIVGAVGVSRFVTPDVVAELREIRDRYTKFRRTEASREPILAFYLSLYLFPALLILFGAVWVSLYLARRITLPLRLVAEGTERIAAGERGVRVDFPAGEDEFAAFIASFNRMSERLARSEEEVEHTRQGLIRKNEELEERRRVMETVFDTVGTGILLVDADGALTAANVAALRLLELDPAALGRLVEQALPGAGGQEIAGLVRRQLSGRGTRQEREVTHAGAEADRQLSVIVVPLPGAPGSPPGALVVLDDRTPLMRAQKVAAWGEVARKLAHEIKNPLTPIQLSAQRIRKAHLKGAQDFERILGECTAAIEQEVEALKNLVDEFAQFARLPAAQLVPASLEEVVDQTLSLYDGLFSEMRLEKRMEQGLPTLRLDPIQIKRVLINLVDNAIEATERRGRVEVSAEYDREHGHVRLGVSDDGPGIPPEDRERLFVPHFSTKRRGSGLGLAIVSRIVQEHHGAIRIEEAEPRGARFVVELPA